MTPARRYAVKVWIFAALAVLVGVGIAIAIAETGVFDMSLPRILHGNAGVISEIPLEPGGAPDLSPLMVLLRNAAQPGTLLSAAAAYRVADVALSAHEREHGCSYNKDAPCPERDPFVKAWCDAQYRLLEAAKGNGRPLTHVVTTTYTLAPWEPHEERTSARWWKAEGDTANPGRTEAARAIGVAGNGWAWRASLPFGERVAGVSDTEPEARDAADAALERLCSGEAAS